MKKFTQVTGWTHLIMISLCLILLCIPTEINAQGESNPMKLWYRQPANVWEEALPIGNGNMGAMVFGNPAKEHLQLNHDEFWAGSPYNNSNPRGPQALEKVRKQIEQGEYKAADSTMNADFVAKKVHGMPYQTVGDLFLKFDNHESYSDYYRELDIQKAITTSRYVAN